MIIGEQSKVQTFFLTTKRPNSFRAVESLFEETDLPTPQVSCDDKETTYSVGETLVNKINEVNIYSFSKLTRFTSESNDLSLTVITMKNHFVCVFGS